jgi:hypothetical protein
MAKQTPELKVGDSVVVKPGTKDVDLSIDLSGWQGRVTEILPGEDNQVLVGIEWDSITLQNMPDSVIEESEEQGLSWTEYRLYADEVELTEPRDTRKDVAQTQEALSGKFAWSFLGPEGRNINKVLAGIDPDDTMAALEAWEARLRKSLTFPFEAKIDEFQERGPLQAGDRVRVLDINFVDDLHGLIVDIKRRGEYYAFPLADLAVLDTRSPNHDPVQEYRVWFANR